MPPFLSCRLRLRLFVIAISASLATGATLTFHENGNTTNVFPMLDCPPPSPSPAPSRSPSHNGAGNGKFEDNVAVLLENLPSSAASTGFASLYRGEGTDRAFARGLCRGDSVGGDCQVCLVTAAVSINNRCNSSRRAAIWYEKCFYADTNASTAFEDAYRQPIQNAFVVSSDKDAFERTYSALMSRLAARVVNGSAKSSPAPMFATGEAVYDPAAPNGTMYGLLQCTRDRTPAECERCLNDSVRMLPSCCYGHRGGMVLAYNCYLRMETFPYYDPTLDAPPAYMPFNGERHGTLTGSLKVMYQFLDQ